MKYFVGFIFGAFVMFMTFAHQLGRGTEFTIPNVGTVLCFRTE